MIVKTMLRKIRNRYSDPGGLYYENQYGVTPLEGLMLRIEE